MIITDLSKKTLDKVKCSFNNWVSEFPNTGVSDYVYDEINLRIFVDFEPISLNELKIRSIEVLDSEYDAIDTDNALVLRKYIREIVEDYNKKKDKEYSDGWNYGEELARERYYNQKYKA